MTCKLPLFTLIWLLAAASAPAQLAVQAAPKGDGALGPAAPRAAPGGQAEALLISAIQTLESRDSVAAKIRYEVDLFDKHLVGLGTYVEQRPGRDHLLRLELKTQIGDKTSSLVQVCDGRSLWTYQNLPLGVKLGRIDLARVVQSLQRADNAAKPGAMGILPGIGGLPKLLRGLDAAFDFEAVEPGRWGQRKLPVWRLRGQWRPQQLGKLLPEQKEAIGKGQPADLSKLADHLPDHVVLLLGQEDLFPYRIEYRRTLAEKQGQSLDQPTRALVAMDLFEVSINVPVDAAQFLYNPGENQVTDQTDAFLASLGLTP